MSLGTQFSKEFGIKLSVLHKLGIFNPTLDVDAPLFIDPFLLPGSRHAEFADAGFTTYEAHFGKVYGLLRLSEENGDKAWKAALDLFRTGESKGFGGTCLGYSKSSTRGRGFGRILSIKSLRWAQQVINLGVRDPELFSSLSLFEDGIGPDLISDMVLRIIFPQVVAFNKRVIAEIKAEADVQLPVKNLQIGKYSEEMIENPFDPGTPIILLADDVLKHLPLMEDVTKLPDLIEHNVALRERVNVHLSEVSKIRYKREKEHLRDRAMESADVFQTFLDMLKELERTPYDAVNDPQGLIIWKSIADNFSALYELDLAKSTRENDIDWLNSIVTSIIDHFRELIEINRMYRVFYDDRKNPRHERFAQYLIYSIASSYCKANSLDISPESNAGSGPVDFKLSNGADKVLVEIKLSTNTGAVKGLDNQLGAYLRSEQTDRGHYVLIDVGELGTKWRRLQIVHRRNAGFGGRRRLWLINAKETASASKLAS